MELTPQLLETQQFPEKWRGYDQDAVDEFLERVGVAVAELQDRLRSATERVRDLESEPGAQFATPEPAFEPMSAPKSAPSEAQQVARALILAQEAADKAVAEANAEADALIAAANDKATRITAEAAAEAKRLTDEAERKHVLAVGKLDGAESHVAKLAEDALAEARTEASRLTVEAQAEADRALATARSDADRLVGDARVNAERGAAEAVAAKADELAALDRKIDEQRVQSDQLSVDLTEREGTLREVVVQLESLVGRFGSLSSSRLDAGTELSTGVGEPVRPTLTVVESESSSDGEDTAELELIDSADDDDAGISTETSARTDELIADELAVEELAVEELAVEELAVEEPAVEEPAVEEPAVEEPAAVEPADDEVADEASMSDFWDEVPARTSAETTDTDTGVDHLAAQVDDSMVIDLTEAGVPSVEAGDAINADSDEAVEDLWAEVSNSDRSAVVDDPFLAALRGPDRVEFDGSGEPDDDRSGFRRRRRTRRLT